MPSIKLWIFKRLERWKPMDGMWIIDKETEFYLSSSIAGGTGAGTFIDLGLMARSILPTAVISGYFILPKIYKQFPSTSRVDGNAYAALKELEFLMGMDLNEGSTVKSTWGIFPGKWTGRLLIFST